MRVAVSLHAQYQEPEFKAVKWNWAIIFYHLQLCLFYLLCTEVYTFLCQGLSHSTYQSLCFAKLTLVNLLTLRQTLSWHVLQLPFLKISPKIKNMESICVLEKCSNSCSVTLTIITPAQTSIAVTTDPHTEGRATRSCFWSRNTRKLVFIHAPQWKAVMC